MTDPNVPPAPNPEPEVPPQVPPAVPATPPPPPPANQPPPPPPPPPPANQYLPPPANQYPPPPPPPPPANQYPPPPPPPPANQYPPQPGMGAQYPPPPPGGYPMGYYASGMPAGPGRQPFSATDAFAYGWKGFTANIGPVIVIALVIVAVNLIGQWLQYAFDNGFLKFLALLVSLFISLVLALGLIRATLIIVDGGTPKVEDVLSTKDLAPYIVASILVSLLVAVGYMLCIIPGIIVAYLLQFYGYAILDKKSDDISGAPSSDPVGALRTSFKLTTSRVGELLLLLILIFVANLLGTLLCFVGLLVTVPVSYIAVAYTWRYFTDGYIAQRS